MFRRQMGAGISVIILNKEEPGYRGVTGRKLVFRLIDIIYYKDDQGRKWAIPAFFLHDKRSAPPFLWFWLPPSIGWQDVAWTIHDFESRCFTILGLTLEEVDGPRFISAMRAVNKSKTRAKWHSRGVRLFSKLGRNNGDGIHRKEYLNEPVQDPLTGKRIPLTAWVGKYYNKDGSGLNDTFPFPEEEAA